MKEIRSFFLFVTHDQSFSSWFCLVGKLSNRVTLDLSEALEMKTSGCVELA